MCVGFYEKVDPNDIGDVPFLSGFMKGCYNQVRGDAEWGGKRDS